MVPQDNVRETHQNRQAQHQSDQPVTAGTGSGWPCPILRQLDCPYAHSRKINSKKSPYSDALEVAQAPR